MSECFYAHGQYSTPKMIRDDKRNIKTESFCIVDFNDEMSYVENWRNIKFTNLGYKQKIKSRSVRDLIEQLSNS